MTPAHEVRIALGYQCQLVRYNELVRLGHPEPARCTLAPRNPGRVCQQVECVTFGAPMVGDQDLCNKVEELGWAADITNIVSRHDIVPRLLLAPWKAGRIAGMSKFLMLLGALS